MAKSQEGIYGSLRLNKAKYLEEYKKLYKEGLDDSEIARKLGVAYTTTRAWRIDLEYPKQFRYKRKFDTEKFKELYEQGYNYSEIARKLNVSSSAIQEYASENGFKSRPKHFKDKPLTDTEFQILLGTIYGDASLIPQGNGLTASCSFTHSLAQQNYCIWKYEQLKRFIPSPPKFTEEYDKRTQKTYYKVLVKTHLSPVIGELYSQVYQNKIKYINKELLSKIEPLGLAVWFMDDGYKNQCGYSLATNCFTSEELDIICEVFKEKFDITPSRTKEKVLLILAKDRNKFTKLIQPYIHSDCLYKLHGIR